MVSFPECDERCTGVLRAAFGLAHASGGPLRPEYILVAIAEGDGPSADALRSSVPGGMRAVALPDWGSAQGSPIALHLQAQGAANAWSLGRAEDTSPEHLLVALVDQGSPGVIRALHAAGIDSDLARCKALEALGAPTETRSIPMPPLTPAGCGDRPALPVGELPQQAWLDLCRRQDRLPLARLHRRSDSGSLYHVERRAARRIASRHSSDPDTIHSLVHHHKREVERRAADSAPHLVGVDPPRGRNGVHHAGPQTPWTRTVPRSLRMFGGWRCWFQNRRVGLRTLWFRSTTLHYYLGRSENTAR